MYPKLIFIMFDKHRIDDHGKQSVFGTPLNLGLIRERITKGESHEKNSRNKFFAIAL